MKVKRFEFPELDRGRVVISETSASLDANNSKQEFENLFERVVAAAVVEEIPQPEKNEVEEIVFKYQEEDLIRSRMQGYEDGYDKGYRAAKIEDEEQNKNFQIVMDNIQKSLQKLPEYVAEGQNVAAQNWTNIILQTAQKLAQESWMRFPEAAVLQMLQEVLALNLEVPKLRIAVAAENLMLVTEKLSAILPSRNPEVEIIGDEKISVGECQIHWHGGGVVRSHEKLLADLGDRLKVIFG